METKKEILHNYTGHGWEGEKFRDVMYDTKEIAKRIRKELKTNFSTCKFSVSKEDYSGGSSIHIYLMQADFNPFKDGIKEKETQLNHYTLLKDYEDGMNNGCVLTKQAHNLLQEVVKIAQKYNYDDSDSMIDYFNTNFYLHINIGKWNKPFQVVEGKKQEEKQNTKEKGVVIGEYKGHPTITLPGNGKGFTFGVTKAALILEYLEDIKNFVESNKA